VFGWSGQYRIRVTAESLSGKPPVVAEFRWDHVVD
jgi:hypothetical protein